MKKSLMAMVLAAMVAVLVTPALAQEEDMGVTVDATWATLYMWRGYNVFDDRPALQPSINWDIFDTGFSVNVWASIPNGAGTTTSGAALDDLNEIDYTAAYNTTFFEEEMYALDMGVNYIYYDFPHANKYFDGQEIGSSFGLPNMLPIGDSYLVPSYYVGWFWNSETPEIDADAPGWFHVFGLSYELPLTCPMTGNEMPLCFAWDITYNDGAFNADSDWSHTTFGISTAMEVMDGLSVSPFISYQQTFEESLGNDDDWELWGGVSVSLSF